MPCIEPFHGFRSLIHPLTQIAAADEFVDFMQAFIDDEWSDLYSDDSPLLEDSPLTLLHELSSMGLRFEVHRQVTEAFDGEDSFWDKRFVGSTIDTLLFGWAFDVMGRLDIDSRVFFHALRSTDLIFIPDPDGIAKEAFQLYGRSLEIYEAVEAADIAVDALQKKHSLPDADPTPPHVQRGEGPRTANPATIDRAAIILQADPSRALTPEEIAQHMPGQNVASLTSALHHAVNYRSPKRMSGCLRRAGTGQYQWVVEH